MAALLSAEDILYRLPDGSAVCFTSGYIPLLVNFTFEDKAAKGLRKRGKETAPDDSVHFSALELVRDAKILLLSGPPGSGKTTFARYLQLHLNQQASRQNRPIIRNELGKMHEEVWEPINNIAHYFSIASREALEDLVGSTLPPLLTQAQQQSEHDISAIIDDFDKAENDASKLLAAVVQLVQPFEAVKLLVLGGTEALEQNGVDSAIVRHEILPLLRAQRHQAVTQLLGSNADTNDVGLGDAASNPAIFALSVESSNQGDQAEAAIDSWVSRVLDSDEEQTKTSQEALAALSAVKDNEKGGYRPFPHKSSQVEPLLRSILVRIQAAKKLNDLAITLVSGSDSISQRGALLVAEGLDRMPRMKDRIKKQLLTIVHTGNLSGAERVLAGRMLSRLGDPRDLTALAQIPAGTSPVGYIGHPKSEPPFLVSLESFAIGLYPVVNRDYAAFVKETGRPWLSPDGFDPERQNVPATDLTWHDAQVYCSWLTQVWRANGKISPSRRVRLPSEPEWERASRGQRHDLNQEAAIYPWGATWVNDAANSEEAGLNTTCAAGFFPNGRSPYGYYDMARHVWEWCTTLWGEDMATPAYTYPWKDDGRQDSQAADSIRRVLRGGCFSSNKLKATCVYRGSLEPNGFWRGNGFRIVVAEDKSYVHALIN